VIGLLRFLAVLYAAILVQTLMVPALALGGVRPDVTFVLVILAAFHHGAAAGALAGFLVGLLVGAGSDGTLGLLSLANGVVGYAVGALASRIVRGSISTQLLILFLAAIFRDQILVFLRLPGSPVEGGRLFITSTLPGGIYTALLGVPALALAEKLVGWNRGPARGLR
jgi:rod shape-determining protein MreD